MPRGGALRGGATGRFRPSDIPRTPMTAAIGAKPKEGRGGGGIRRLRPSVLRLLVVARLPSADARPRAGRAGRYGRQARPGIPGRQEPTPRSAGPDAREARAGRGLVRLRTAIPHICTLARSAVGIQPGRQLGIRALARPPCLWHWYYSLAHTGRGMPFR